MERFNYKKALWYWEALQYSDLQWKIVNQILQKVNSRKSVIDIASGPGTVSLPLSYFFKKIYSVDVSQGMLKKEKEELLYRNINNVSVINSDWKSFIDVEDEISLIIVMNFGGIFEDFDKFIDLCKEKSPEFVLIVKGVSKSDKFGRDSIKMKLGREPKAKCFDGLLAEKLAFFEKKPFTYNFDQPFNSIDEAIDFWNEYINPKNEREEAVIVEHVNKSLIKRGNKFFAPVNSSANLYWWKP